MYLEPLPPSCPPTRAIEPTKIVVYRLIKANPIKSDDFHSHKQLGLVPPAGVDACRWSSCSVFDDLKKLQAMLLLPKYKGKFKHIASLTLSNKSGRVLKGHGGHYDWWIYHAFDPVKASTIVA